MNLITNLSWNRLIHNTIIRQRETGNYWIVEVEAVEGVYPAGILVCEPATPGDGLDVTFTAANGLRYRSTCSGSLFIPGAHLTHVRPTPEEYAADFGRHCPNCGSEYTVYDGYVHSGDKLYPHVTMTCDNCDAKWRETLAITGYENLEVPA